MRIVRLPILAVAALSAMLLLAACDDDEEPATPTPAGSPAATASPAPTGGASPATATPSPEPFSGSAEPAEKEASPAPPAAIMTDVRTGTHQTFDRVVFDFQNGLPGYRVEYVSPPIIADASGLEVEIEGSAFLRVRLTPAATYDPDTGTPVYTGPPEITPGLASVLEIEKTGDFEGILTWVFGLPGELDFRVIELSDPDRIVIDIAHP